MFEAIKKGVENGLFRKTYFILCAGSSSEGMAAACVSLEDNRFALFETWEAAEDFKKEFKEGAKVDRKTDVVEIPLFEIEYAGKENYALICKKK